MNTTPEQRAAWVALWADRAGYWREVAERFELQAREGWLDDAAVAARAAREMEARAAAKAAL